MNSERQQHMTIQYIWALENEQAFMLKARHEVERGNFSAYRRLVGAYIRPVRQMLEEDKDGALSGPEWSFLYLELWSRLGGCNISHSNDLAEFQFQLQRLNEAGFDLTKNGVVRRPKENPCAEIQLGTTQPCNLQQPEGEEAMCNTITIVHKTLINSVDVTTMSDEQLIDAIKKVEKEIEELKSVKTKSKKIAAKVQEANDTLAKLVELLDAR